MDEGGIFLDGDEDAKYHTVHNALHDVGYSTKDFMSGNFKNDVDGISHSFQ